MMTLPPRVGRAPHDLAEPLGRLLDRLVGVAAVGAFGDDAGRAGGTGAGSRRIGSPGRPRSPVKVSRRSPPGV